MEGLVTLIVGNWKMHGGKAALAEVRAVAAGAVARGCEIWLAPSFTLISAAADVAGAGGGLMVGGQDCHHAAQGAHTGCVSAGQLVDAGASFVILGHSERRSDQHETDADVRAKLVAAQAAGLTAIVCVGETEGQRDAGEAEAVVGAQLAGSLSDTALEAGADRLLLAYEPVWAIGTGRTPEEADVAAMHRFMRDTLRALFGERGAGVRLLYGGSVKPGNAGGLMRLPGVDGALVGGASLKADSLLAIVDAAG